MPGLMNNYKDSFSHARDSLSDSERKMFESLFLELETRGFISSIDAYQVVSYVRISSQLTDLLKTYDPSNPIIKMTKTVDSIDGTSTTVQEKLDPRHTIYKDLLKQQAALVKALGIDLLSRMNVRRVEQRDRSFELAERIADERREQHRLALEQQLTIVRENREAIMERLKITQGRNEKTQAERRSMQQAMLELRERESSINEQLTQIRIEKIRRDIDGRDQPKTYDVENPVRMLASSNAGRKKQLALRAGKGKKKG